jgi:peptidylprolyl isomerase
MSRRVPLAALAVALIALAGCGGGGKKTTSAAAPAAAQPDTQTQTQTTPAQSGGSVKVVASKSTNLKKKPKIPKQPGDPPSTLVKQDIVKGTGATAKAGDTVTVQYVGARFRDGVQFDASWDRGQPFVFPLGGGQVIQGWDQGVAGMKVGGRRQLTIPPDLGYGPQGQPPLIAPNETLIFVVDLKKVRRQG